MNFDNGVRAQINDTISQKAPAIRFQNAKLHKSEEGIRFVVKYESDLPDEVHVQFYLFGTVRKRLLGKRTSSAGDQQIIFGPFPEVWHSTYQVQSIIRRRHHNANLIRKPRKYQFKNSFFFRTKEDVPPPLKQRRMFWERYRGAVATLFRLYIERFPELVRMVHETGNRSLNSSTGGKQIWSSVVNELKNVRKLSFGSLESELPDGFPYRSEIERLNKLTFAAQELFRRVFLEIYGKEASNSQEMVPDELRRNLGNDRVDLSQYSRDGLRVEYFLPRLSASLTRIYHPVRSSLFGASHELTKSYPALLGPVFDRLKLEEEQEESDNFGLKLDEVIDRFKDRKSNIGGELNRQLWLFRDRMDSLGRKEKRFRADGLFLRRSMNAFVESGEKLKENVPDLRQLEGETGKEVKASLKTLLKDFLKMVKLADREAVYTLENVYSQFQEGFSVLERNLNDSPEVKPGNFGYLPGYFEQWRSRWKQHIDVVVERGKQLSDFQSDMKLSKQRRKNLGINEVRNRIRTRIDEVSGRLANLGRQLNEIQSRLQEFLKDIQENNLSEKEVKEEQEHLKDTKDQIRQTLRSISNKTGN